MEEDAPSPAPPAATVVTVPDRISRLECTYGLPGGKTGGLLPRLNALELLVFADQRKGTLPARVAALEEELAEEHKRLQMLFQLDADVDDDDGAHDARLLGWARAVCANFGVDVADVGPSFADGRALCVLVHAYAPRLLPLRLVQTPPALLSCPSAPAEWRSVNYGYLLNNGGGEGGGEVDPEAVAARKAAVAACKSNFALAASVCRALGGAVQVESSCPIAPESRLVYDFLVCETLAPEI